MKNKFFLPILMLLLLFTAVKAQQCDTVYHASSNCVCVICPDTIILNCSLPVIEIFDYQIISRGKEGTIKVYWDVESEFLTETFLIWEYQDQDVKNKDSLFVFEQGNDYITYLCYRELTLTLRSVDVNGDTAIKKIVVPPYCKESVSYGQRTKYFNVLGQQQTKPFAGINIVYVNGTFKKTFYVF